MHINPFSSHVSVPALTIVRAAAIAAVSVATAAAATAAEAAVYCVDTPSTTGCDHVESPGGTAGLSAALAAADASTGVADTIEVGPGTYTGQFAATSGGGALTVTGAGSSGASVTTLTVANDSQTVLALGATGSSVSHVELQLPARTGDTALDLNGSVADVTVDDPNGSTNAIGVEMDHPDSFTGTIKLANGDGSIGINRTANGSGAEMVVNSTIDAGLSVLATSGTWTVDHDKLAAVNRGIQAASGNNGTGVPAVVIAADTLIHITTTDPSTCGLIACFGLGVSGNSTIDGDRLTVVAGGEPIAGADVLGAFAGETATLALGSSVITGFTPALECTQSNGGSATLTADYSAFTTATATGGCTAPTGPHDLEALADPDFATGTFEPKWDSPLIDAGNPNAIFLPGPTDLNGNPRVVDGNGDGSAILDIGAFEYQHQPPTVTAQTLINAKAGAQVPFAVVKASDADPGDTLTFTWSFDDGGSAAGPHVTHAFATPGSHSATVTATDPTGLTSTSTVRIDIAAKSPPSKPPRPKITKLKQSRTRWRLGSKLASLARRQPRSPVGTVFSFTLNTAAKLTLTFTHSVPGRRVHRKCMAPSRSNRRKPSCRRSVTVGTLSFAGGRAGANRVRFQGRLSRHHRLAAGTYTLTVTATNPAGRSAPARASFTIAPGR